MRVIDLFRQFDDDSSGFVDYQEFVKAMFELGLDAPEEAIAAVFASFDPNSDGRIEYSELHDLLVKSFVTHPQLEPLDTKAMNKIALRKSRVVHGASNPLGNLVLESASLDTISQQLRNALYMRKARVIDLFRSVDEDASGLVTASEFRTYLARFGCNAPGDDIQAVFDAIDIDGSGSIEYEERACRSPLSTSTQPCYAEALTPSRQSPRAPPYLCVTSRVPSGGASAVHKLLRESVEHTPRLASKDWGRDPARYQQQGPATPSHDARPATAEFPSPTCF